ncbi:MAG: class I SAM-dependent methyltransferase [Gaiellaceae bacterium]
MEGPGVHEIAARGFGRGAEDYERGRPGYPPEAIELLARELALVPGRTVLDVGAGTGKLTRLLVPTGARVLALEPVADMREQLVAAAPGIELVEGTAEAIPLAEGAVDAITCATAFHWFDGERALAEFHRVLPPGGGLALVWNTRDESVEWVRDLHGVLADAVTENCDPPARAKARELLHLDWRAPFASTDFFEPAAERLIPHVHEADVDTQVARFRSASFISVMPDETRARFSAALGQFLRTHPETRGSELIRFPYVCEVYCFRAR